MSLWLYVIVIIVIRDALNKALVDYRSANYRPVPINTKELILLCYLSYLLRLRLLPEDSYLLEGLQSADETKTHTKAKLQNAPNFTGNGSHSHVCLLMVIKIKTCTYQLCKRQSPNTNVLISRYRLLVDYCASVIVILLIVIICRCRHHRHTLNCRHMSLSYS